MMKMYKQPQTDVIAFETKLMQDITTMSPGGPGTGQMDAPARRHGDIID